MTLQALRKLATQSPFIVKANKGMVELILVPHRVKGFKYQLHDTCSESGISLTEGGKEFSDKFASTVGHRSGLFKINDAAEVVQKSIPFFEE